MLNLVQKFIDKLVRPSNPDPYKSSLDHIDYLREEVRELELALDARNDVEVIDGVCDVVFVALNQGLQYLEYMGISKKEAKRVLDECLKEVCKSNLSKLENGKAIYREDGKVMKGKDYFKPDIAGILAETPLQGEDVEGF